MMFARYPISIQSTYADLLERVKLASLDEFVMKKGTYVAKNIKGRKYWYFQHYVDGKKKQKYIVPFSGRTMIAVRPDLMLHN